MARRLTPDGTDETCCRQEGGTTTRCLDGALMALAWADDGQDPTITAAALFSPCFSIHRPMPFYFFNTKCQLYTRLHFPNL